MNRRLLDVFVCPLSRTTLQLKNAVGEESISQGELVSSDGATYTIDDGIPNFLSPSMLSASELATQAEYDVVADKIYDIAVDWLFASFYEDEDSVRESMIDGLQIGPGSRVLEIGCGTGRDSFRIARRLSAGEFFVQDVSRNMVRNTRRRLDVDRERIGLTCDLHYFVSSGRHLPFADRYFDAVFHFGGFNNFSEQKKSMAEMARVVRTGGKVVVGDESLPPWFEGTEFGEIVVTNNPMFRYKLPLDSLPPNVRDVIVKWVLGGCFYLIEFKTGAGTPPLNLDLPHRGWRGGTMRTRYFGRLEGITPDAKQMAIDAARQSGLSVHEWLDRLVRQATKSGTE